MPEQQPDPLASIDRNAVFTAALRLVEAMFEIENRKLNPQEYSHASTGIADEIERWRALNMLAFLFRDHIDQRRARRTSHA